jgi:hypothetical protein
LHHFQQPREWIRAQRENEQRFERANGVDWLFEAAFFEWFFLVNLLPGSCPNGTFPAGLVEQHQGTDEKNQPRDTEGDHHSGNRVFAETQHCRSQQRTGDETQALRPGQQNVLRCQAHPTAGNLGEDRCDYWWGGAHQTGHRPHPQPNSEVGVGKELRKCRGSKSRYCLCSKQVARRSEWREPFQVAVITGVTKAATSSNPAANNPADFAPLRL